MITSVGVPAIFSAIWSRAALVGFPVIFGSVLVSLAMGSGSVGLSATDVQEALFWNACIVSAFIAAIDSSKFVADGRLAFECVRFSRSAVVAIRVTAVAVTSGLLALSGLAAIAIGALIGDGEILLSLPLLSWVSGIFGSYLLGVLIGFNVKNSILAPLITAVVMLVLFVLGGEVPSIRHLLPPYSFVGSSMFGAESSLLGALTAFVYLGSLVYFLALTVQVRDVEGG